MILPTSIWETNHQVQTIFIGRSHLSLYIPHKKSYSGARTDVEMFSSSIQMRNKGKSDGSEEASQSTLQSESIAKSLDQVDMNKWFCQSYNSTLLFGVGGDRKVYIKNFSIVYQYNLKGELSPYLMYIMTDGQLSCFSPPSLNLYCMNKYRNSSNLPLPEIEEETKDLRSLVSLITLMKNAQTLNQTPVDRNGP